MLELRADDPIMQELDFKPYRYTTKRQAKQFRPTSNHAQTIDIETPWGGVLTGKSGDYLVNEYDNPKDQWVVDKDIFEESYQELENGVYYKKAIVELVPLTQITNNPDQEIIIHSLEGPLTVRSGDFHLARGITGEVWPIPNEGIPNNLEPVE
ncbi:MAG: hypothetical protein B5M51_09860 [Anaerolinea sp. 4484_236]|nr:MAG: hypothetical protein B5M51_09860 [Anaerolinea sp. 4484_236]